MDFEQLLNETRYTTEETVERLKPLLLKNGGSEKLMDRYRFEREKIKAKYPQISDRTQVMKSELYDYLVKLIPAIKEMYGKFIPLDRMQKLEGLLNSENIVVIDDAEDKHDFSANSETGQVIVNLSTIAKEEGKDIYDKLVTAKGGLPHEVFHFIIRMLKPDQLADERMTITLFSGESIPSRGMVGFMVSEGLVEKVSNDFCVKQEQLFPGEFYHSVAPQYIPYVNICNYIMQNSKNVQNIFSIDYEEFLNNLTPEEQAKYKQAECISYAVRHGDEEDKFGRKVSAEEIAFAKVEKVSINNQFDNMTVEELNKLKDSLDSQEEQTIDSGLKR